MEVSILSDELLRKTIKYIFKEEAISYDKIEIDILPLPLLSLSVLLDSEKDRILHIYYRDKTENKQDLSQISKASKKGLRQDFRDKFCLLLESETEKVDVKINDFELILSRLIIVSTQEIENIELSKK